MNEAGLRRVLPDQSLGSGHTLGTHHPILSKRVCFYKSGDPQFNGLHIVINNRTFKTFDALLDSLSKKVPLPFGVRNITTPRGVHAVSTLDELEDGKSYICSDSRKVKPINLALARKKPPPWYHARPASSRRQTVQQARFFPGRNIHKQEAVYVRTPKRLLVFRNGDPTVKHSVVLHKRTARTFESVLEYISQMIQFHVVKLHTADGRRVDGLPALILCSGTVVAVGREPFRPANYNAQKSPDPTMLPPKQMGHRRLKRKKKSLSYTSRAKPRNFSPSSERYIVNQIHNSMAESSCDVPSHSVELESGRMLESVPETPDTEEQDSFLPAEDDIEKSFRVNQDGSMTVEMRVRLTIKEEETVQWTTTLARSSVANQLNVSHLPEPKVSSLESLDLPTASIDIINRDKWQDNKDEDPPSGNGAFSEGSNEEGDVRVQTAMVSPRRVPTPGHMQIRKKQASVESIKSVTTEGIQEDRVGSYSYTEQTENGAVTEQYCMVKQSSSRPVPKPRRLGSVEANMNSGNISTFKSAEMTETLQLESSGEEVTETVLHVYEQQTCQENFFANLFSHGMSASGVPFCRPATSETGQRSSSLEFEPQLWRPSTASESTRVWRAESSSVTSDLTLHQRTGAIQATKAQQQSPKATKGKGKSQYREVNKDKRLPTKHKKSSNARIRQIASPGKKRKENLGATEKNKKVKTFSSAGFIKKIYGSKSKSAKSTMRLKKGRSQNGNDSVTTMSSQQSDGTLQCIFTDPNMPSALTETTNEAVPIEKNSLGVAPNEVSQARGILTRQTSMHREKQNKNKSGDVSGSMSLPPFNSSSSVTRQYVENWLEKAHLNPSAYPDEENINLEAENSRCGKGLMIVGDEVKDTSQVQTLKPSDLLDNTPRASVKQRIQSFENKSSSPLMEKKANRTTNANTETYKIKLLSKPKCSEIILPREEETPAIMLSTHLPLPPPHAETAELSNTEYCMMDVSSVPSSPLYRLSSVSSQMTDNQPLPISPTSDKAVSPTDHSMEMATSIHADIPSMQREALSPRSPSITRAHLESNTSLGKDCLDKYTVGSEATSDTNSSSTPINIADHNKLPNGTCSTGVQQPRETPPGETQQTNSGPSCCTSASPTSSSEERMSTTSISSSGDPTQNDLPFKATKIPLLTQKEVLSPKLLMSSLSPNKKVSSELPHNSPKLPSSHNHPPDKTMSPNIGIQRHAKPNTSPTSERKLYKPKTQKRQSPYSQSLDMASPPVRHKSNRLMRNLASDEASEQTNKTQRKTLSQRKGRQTSQSIKSIAELDKTPTSNTLVSLQAHQSHENKGLKTDDLITGAEEEHTTHKMPQPLNVSDQPNMKPVLEKICYSIKLIRQITQSKRPSCLEKSNSLPDFSSHVASTFGSSSKALLAFLSVMTLKEGLTDPNMDELNTNNVSCAEALKMIDSLREIASIEDSHELKVSLVNLQQSASKQLLHSWKGFQDLGYKCKSQSSTPNDSEQSVETEASPERDCGVDENVIDEIVDNLDLPEKLKEELTSLSMGIEGGSDDEEETEKVETNDNTKAKIYQFSTADTSNVIDVTQDEKVSVDVSSIIQKLADINQPKQSMGGITKDRDSLNGQNGKCPPAEHQREQGHSEHKSNQEKAETNGVVSSKGSLGQDRSKRSSEIEEQDQLQMNSEDESTHDDESGSDEEGLTEDLEQNKSCKQSVSCSETGDRHSSEEEPEAESEQIREERRGNDDPSAESHSEEEEVKQPSSNFYAELNVKAKKGISSSHSETKYSSEEEQPMAEYKKLKVIIEESLSGGEEEEEAQFVEIPNHGEQIKKGLSLIEETEEDMVSSDEDHHAHKTLTYSENTVHVHHSTSLETQDSYTKKDNSTEQRKSYRFDADDDSGNDHSSCDEHVEVEQTKADLGYEEKEASSDDKHDIMERFIEESHAEYQEAPLFVTQSKDAKCEKAVDKLEHQSVAERVILLEKQVADAQRTKGRSGMVCLPQRNTPLESDVESPTSRSTPSSRSAPQSSLSFSYDSSGVITTEPEGNRVKSIREMFLAKSATDIQRELRAETSTSGGYQTQSSSELSSGEEDTARKSITKGFVRRTIERLYGKKEPKSDEEASETLPSASKQKKKEHSSMFSPFHKSPTKAELSYFNSANMLDTLSCVAFNTQVRPEDSVPADDDQWLLRENTMIRKSLSDPVGINKNLINSPPDNDTEENAPYSLFSSKSEIEDKRSSFSRKCTYFSLPHASDSDAFQDELSISKSSVNGDSITEIKDITEDTKTWEERNGTLPGAAIPDFKMKDNKVHPLPPPDGEVVVAQPGKGQGVMSRVQEPDMLDILYNFCGQNCPIL